MSSYFFVNFTNDYLIMFSNRPSQENILSITKALLSEFGCEAYDHQQGINSKLHYGKLEFRNRRTNRADFSLVIGIDAGSSEWDDPSSEFFARLEDALKRSHSQYLTVYSGFGHDFEVPK